MDPFPPPPALQRHLQLETDLFCFGCGYNLHGQVVTPDERLGFLVCRCPECGRFHPAAMGVSATRPWLARLGVLLVSVLAMVIFFVTGFTGLFLGVCMYAHLDQYTTTIPLNTAFMKQEVRILAPEPMLNSNNYYYYESQYETAWKIDVGFTTGLALFYGMFTAVVMWHVDKRRLAWLMLYPLLIALIVFGLWYANADISRVLEWSIARLASYGFYGMVCMGIGQLIGRPVARFLLRWTIAPKLRQHVHFLWRCDGKTPPGVT